MQVSVKKLDGLERRMTVQIPAEKINQEVDNRLNSLSRKVKVHGFRPGKVPFKVVKRMYGRQVRREVIGELLQSSFEEALNQQQLRLVGDTKIEPKDLDGSGDFEYDATFEIFPELEVVGGLDDLKVERPIAEITEADIDAMVETVRWQRAVWNGVERPAQKGDRVIVTFEGKVDGQDFAGNKGENVPAILGEGRLFESFENALLGLEAGSEKAFDVAFPEDFHTKEIAGKTVHFTVKLSAVAEPALPEVNEALAASLGVGESGVEGLRKALRENMERELKEKVQHIVKKQLMDSLIEANDILIPQAMLKEEVKQLAQKAGLADPNKDSEEIPEAMVEIFEQEARRRVTLGLIAKKIVAMNNIKFDDARLQARLETIASTYENGAQVLEWYRQNPQAYEEVRALALEDQVVDWLLERAEVIDKHSNFNEIMKSTRA